MPVYVPISLNLVILQTKKPPARPSVQIPFQQTNLQPNPLPPMVRETRLRRLTKFLSQPSIPPKDQKRPGLVELRD